MHHQYHHCNKYRVRLRAAIACESKRAASIDALPAWFHAWFKRWFALGVPGVRGGDRDLLADGRQALPVAGVEMGATESKTR